MEIEKERGEKERGRGEAGTDRDRENKEINNSREKEPKIISCPPSL